MTHSFHLSIYLDFTNLIDLYPEDSFCASDMSSSLEFVQEMTTDFMQTVRLFNIGLHVVWNGGEEGGNSAHDYFKLARVNPSKLT